MPELTGPNGDLVDMICPGCGSDDMERVEEDGLPGVLCIECGVTWDVSEVDGA